MSANKESTGRYQPVAKAGMLIRKPVAEVFEALVNPAITSRFWFSKGSSRLEESKQVRWEWGMYDFSVPVDVMAFLRLAASGYAREAFQKHVAPSFRHHNPFPGDAEGAIWMADLGLAAKVLPS